MNAYIDLGTCYGLFISRFKISSMYKPDFKIYAWECNPFLKTREYGDDVIHIRKAAWIYDGEMDFYMSIRGKPYVQSCTAYKNKRTGYIDPVHPVKVSCVDFSKWLKENFKIEDYVIIKCNIEGAEYDIFEKCIADGTINLVKELHIQWHWNKIKIPIERHNKLLLELNKYPVKLYSGYGQFKK